MSHYIGDLMSDISLLKSLADESDAISMDRFNAHDLSIETKPDLTPVTDADKSIEKRLREILSNERASDLVVGEEYGRPESIQPNTRYWVIDPIDGTKNFLRGVPIWATLIGLIHRDDDGNDRVIAGMVSAPALFRRWYAALGFGAFAEVNSGPAVQIHVSKIARIEDSSLSFSDLSGWAGRREKFLELANRSWRLRGIGDFWSHMLVAEGAVDIAAEPLLALWDMAAVSIIVSEAGGRFSDFDGNAGPFGTNGLSTNGYLHNEVLGALS